MHIKMIFDGIIHGVGKEFFGASLLSQDFVEHPAVAEQFVLPPCTGVVFVVKILQRTGRETTVLEIEIGIPFTSCLHAGQVLVEQFEFPGHGPCRHVNDHLLECPIIIERPDSDFSQGDRVLLQLDDKGIHDSHGGVDRYQTAAVTDATDPQSVDSLSGNEKKSLEVGDGATMSHLADHVCVANRNQAVGCDNPTKNGQPFFGVHSIIALGEGPHSYSQNQN